MKQKKPTAKPKRPLLTVIRAFKASAIRKIVDFTEDHPCETLGPHLFKRNKSLVINSFLPHAEQAWVELSGADIPLPMRKVHARGFFQTVIKNVTKIIPYQITFKDESGRLFSSDDPYACSTDISDYDLHLLGEGNHFKSYDRLGAQLKTLNGIMGVHFAVWAPNAKTVCIVGNFNRWVVGAHPMTRMGASGIWALFIPGLKEGELYKFAIRSRVDDEVRIKADPYAFRAEMRPQSASVVAELKRYQWKDSSWMNQRHKDNLMEKPLSIYEVHLGSWKRKGPDSLAFLSYRQLAHELVGYVKRMGYTHIELLPIMEHPLDQSWGYQVLSYFAPTSRFGTPDDFMYFVDYCHRHGVGVILDWVPSHFPKDGHGLAFFDGKQIYAYEDWKKGEHQDWSTFIFDYGKNEVTNFLISSALFWLEKYHIDGLRVDAVASMLYLDYSRKEGQWQPNQYGGRENLEAITFLKKFNEIIRLNHPGIMTFAEESTAWPGVSRPTYTGGLGFTMKWNMGWMHDTLDYFSKDPVHRQFHRDKLTFSLLYAFTENFLLPLSHDEVVHGKGSLIGKMPGDEWQKFANLRLFLGLMYAHPGKKLLFMGGDFAQSREWDAQKALDWHLLDYAPHRQVNQFVRDLNQIYQTNKAFYEVDFESAGFEWIDFSDTHSSMISFLRWSKNCEELLLVTCNMTPIPKTQYRLGVPRTGFYEEILNSDAEIYGGTGMGNLGGIPSQPIPWQGRDHSVIINLPPLGINIYRLTRHREAAEGSRGDLKSEIASPLRGSQ